MTTTTVIIPAFNARPFIAEALDSVLAQSQLPGEIIVVDDGSDDGTSSIVESWSSRNGRPVKLIRQANQGASVARNCGLAAARGSRIALLDADDIWLPNHVASLSEAMDAVPNAVLAFGDTIYFSQDSPDSPPTSRDKAIDAAEQSIGSNRYTISQNLFNAILPGLFFSPTSALFDREAALGIGGFDNSIKYVEDRDFFLRLSRNNTFVFCDTVISRNRIHQSNITHPRNTIRNAFFVLRILRKLRADTSRLALTEVEIALTRAESRKMVRHILLAASASGLPTYFGAVRRLLSEGEEVGSRFGTRGFLRSIYYSLKGH